MINPIKKFKDFTNKKDEKYIFSKFNYSLGPLSFLFGIRNWWWRIFISVIVGLIAGVATLFLIQNTGLYTAGLSGIFQGIARVSHFSLLNNGVDENTSKLYYDLIFYGIYLLANIPLLIFAYFKIGKNFAILSFNVILLQNIIPILLGLIPNIENILIFGETQSESLQESSIIMSTYSNIDLSKFGSLITYALFWGLISGVNYSLILVVSGSTGGLDFISFYYSIKKGKPIGMIIMYFNTISILLSIIIGTYVPVSMYLQSHPNIIYDNIGPYSYHLFFSQNLIMSIFAVLISSLVLNVLFPKNKIIKVSIYSENIIKIRDELYKNNFHHALTIYNTIGGYSLKEKQNADIVCLYIELPKLLRTINAIDPNSLVTITHITGMKGLLKVEESID